MGFPWEFALTILFPQGNSRAISTIVKERAGEIEKKRSLIAPVLRIVTSFTSLVDSADFLEVSLFSSDPHFLPVIYGAFGNRLFV